MAAANACITCGRQRVPSRVVHLQAEGMVHLASAKDAGSGWYSL